MMLLPIIALSPNSTLSTRKNSPMKMIVSICFAGLTVTIIVGGGFWIFIKCEKPCKSEDTAANTVGISEHGLPSTVGTGEHGQKFCIVPEKSDETTESTLGTSEYGYKSGTALEKTDDMMESTLGAGEHRYKLANKTIDVDSAKNAPDNQINNSININANHEDTLKERNLVHKTLPEDEKRINNTLGEQEPPKANSWLCTVEKWLRVAMEKLNRLKDRLKDNQSSIQIKEIIAKTIALLKKTPEHGRFLEDLQSFVPTYDHNGNLDISSQNTLYHHILLWCHCVNDRKNLAQDLSIKDQNIELFWLCFVAYLQKNHVNNYCDTQKILYDGLQYARMYPSTQPSQLLDIYSSLENLIIFFERATTNCEQNNLLEWQILEKRQRGHQHQKALYLIITVLIDLYKENSDTQYLQKANEYLQRYCEIFKSSLSHNNMNEICALNQITEKLHDISLAAPLTIEAKQKSDQLHQEITQLLLHRQLVLKLKSTLSYLYSHDGHPFTTNSKTELLNGFAKIKDFFLQIPNINLTDSLPHIDFSSIYSDTRINNTITFEQLFAEIERVKTFQYNKVYKFPECWKSITVIENPVVNPMENPVGNQLKKVKELLVKAKNNTEFSPNGQLIMGKLHTLLDSDDQFKLDDIQQIYNSMIGLQDTLYKPEAQRILNRSILHLCYNLRKIKSDLKYDELFWLCFADYLSGCYKKAKRSNGETFLIPDFVCRKEVEQILRYAHEVCGIEYNIFDNTNDECDRHMLFVRQILTLCYQQHIKKTNLKYNDVFWVFFNFYLEANTSPFLDGHSCPNAMKQILVYATEIYNTQNPTYNILKIKNSPWPDVTLHMTLGRFLRRKYDPEYNYHSYQRSFYTSMEDEFNVKNEVFTLVLSVLIDQYKHNAIDTSIKTIRKYLFQYLKLFDNQTKTPNNTINIVKMKNLLTDATASTNNHFSFPQLFDAIERLNNLPYNEVYQCPEALKSTPAFVEDEVIKLS